MDSINEWITILNLPHILSKTTQQQQAQPSLQHPSKGLDSSKLEHHLVQQMAPFEALYGRKCRTPLCWFQDGESVLIGPELIQQTNEKVKNDSRKIENISQQAKVLCR